MIFIMLYCGLELVYLPPLNTLDMKKLLLSLSVITSLTVIGQTNTSSISFDGVDDAVVIGEHVIHEIDDNISILGAFKFNSLTNNDNIIVSREGNYEIGLNGSTMQLKWAISNTSPGWTWTSDGMNLTADTWYWFGFTYANGEVKIYINGNLQATVPATGTIGDSDNGAYNELWVGDRHGDVTLNHALNGSVDELHIWNVVLTEQEIQDYMNCPPTGNESGLVGYWNFEEGTGTIAGDLTSNGNDGTLIGGVTWSTDVPEYNCNVGVSELSSNNKELIKIVNLLGQEVEFTPNTVLIYQYSDGTSEKVFTIED